MKLVDSYREDTLARAAFAAAADDDDNVAPPPLPEGLSGILWERVRPPEGSLPVAEHGLIGTAIAVRSGCWLVPRPMGTSNTVPRERVPLDADPFRQVGRSAGSRWICWQVEAWMDGCPHSAPAV